MRVDAKLLADHLKVISMKNRISEVTFGPDFSAEVVDGNEEVICKAKSSRVQFPDSFAVMDLGDFVRLVDSFNGEVNLDIKDGKVVIGSSIGVVSYQTADPATITTTIKNFGEMVEKYFADPVVKAKVSNAFPGNYGRFQRLISPDLIEFFMKDGKLAALLVSMKGHRAEIFVGEPSMVKDEGFKFKISAGALTDVIAGFQTTQSHEIIMAIGKALRLDLDDDYTFAISPQAE